MATRKTPTVATSNPWDPVALWSSVLDLPRQQAAVATHAANVMLGGFDAMRQAQEKITQQAWADCAGAAQKLQRGSGPLDVLAVQMELARVGFQAGTAWCQQMTNAALQTEACAAACGCELLDTGKVLESLAQFDRH